MKLPQLVLAAVAAAFMFAGTGCANSKQTAERDSLLNQNKELQDQLQAERAKSMAAESQTSALRGQLASTPAATPSVPDMGGDPLLLGGATPSRTARTPATPARTTSTTPVRITTATPKVAAPVKQTISGPVLFDSGKTTLNAAAMKALDTIAATIKKQYAGQKLVIEGFTDSTPVKSTSKVTNEQLAQARAAAVKAYLVKKGVPTADMTVKSFGAADPVSTKNLALNRRVEVAVLASAK
jgi:OOP family OmpA-OmpF porin